MPGGLDTAIRDDRAPTVARPSSNSRTDAAVLVGLAVLSIGLPLVVAWAGGALGIPRGDDFSYEGILFHWSRTGSLRFDNWPAMTLVGQLAIARPLVEIVGPRVTALQVLTTSVGAVGVCGTYLLLCRVTVRRIAVAAVLTTVLGPLWAPLAASFMTDVWAYTAIVLCLLVGCVGLSSQGGRRLALLASSAAIGLVAVSIRESGFLAPLAVLGVAGWSFVLHSRRHSNGLTVGNWQKRDGVGLVLIAAVLVAAVGLVLGWRSSVPYGGPSSLKSIRETLEDPSPLDMWRAAVKSSLSALFTLSLLTLPATALVSVGSLIRRIARPRPAVAVGACLSAAVLAVMALDRGPIGNYVTRELGPSLSFGTPDDRLPKLLWAVLAVGSAYSCFVLSLCVVSALGSRVGRDSRSGPNRSRPSHSSARQVITIFALLSVALMVVSGPFGQPVYDRHLLPLLPLVAAFILIEGGLRRIARERFVLAAGLVLGAFAVLGLVFSTSAAVYHGARWEAASELVASGVDPLRIDGGLDWVGFHSRKPQRVPPQDTWLALRYSDFRPCILIASGDVHLRPPYGPKPVRTWVTHLPFGGDMRLRAFESLDCHAVGKARGG